MKRLSRTIATSALALAVGALLAVVALRPSAPVTASTVPLPVASASPGDVVGCDPIDPTLGPEGQLDLPLRCYLPPAKTVTETVTVTTPVPTTVTETVTVTPSPTPTSLPPTTPAPTTVAPTLPPTPTPTPSPSTPSPTPSTTPNSGWPDATNTGVPSMVALTPWTGSCTISTPQTITGRSFACDVTVNAAVVIRESRINGTVKVNGSLTMTDSEVHATPGSPRQVTGVENHDFTLLRVEVTGGNRGVYCARNCVIRDSYVHGQKIASTWHASAVRLEQYGTLEHSTVLCDAAPTAQGGSCSADLTMYPDFAPVHHVTVEGNYFSPVVGGYWCAYGGATSGKPYSGSADNATYIAFRNNVFERGRFGRCGGFADGNAVTDFAANRTGNVWVSNVYDNGVAVRL